MRRCSALNCSSRQEYGGGVNKIHFYVFPKKINRRAIWVKNIRRGDWQPNKGSRLCEVRFVTLIFLRKVFLFTNILCYYFQKHFDKSQFENHRADGRIQLKPFAIPTIFDVPKQTPQMQIILHKVFMIFVIHN